MIIDKSIFNFGIMVTSYYHSLQILNLINGYNYEDLFYDRGALVYLYLNIILGASLGLYVASTLNLIQN
jgi:hypothetical protein